MRTATIQGGGDVNRMTATVDGLTFDIDRTEEDGPRSVDFLLIALGACTYATVGYYLSRKDLTLEGLKVEVSSDRAETSSFYEKISIRLHLNEAFTEDQRKVIRGVAMSCRIHKTLVNGPEIDLALVS